MLGDMQAFFLGAAINFLVAVLVVRFIYFPSSREKSFVFSFLAFNTIIYFVLRFLTGVELSLGFGFGLFALFSVLRYRTDELPIREMTYLFTIIGLAVMNSFLSSTDDLAKLLVANGAVVVLLYGLEQEWGFGFESSLRMRYEMIELITPANRELMLTDLRKRTGLPVKRVQIGKIDFLRDVADITVYYDKPVAARRAVTESSVAKVAGPVRQPSLK